MSSTVGDGLPYGKTVRSQGRTIGEGEFAMLTNLTWTTRERHVNGPLMSDRGEADRELAGPVVVAIIASLAALAPLNRELREQYGVKTLAAMGLEAEFGAPVRPEDTLWAESEVVEARDSASRPGQGVLTLRDRGVNQRGDTVVVLTRTLLITRGPSTEEATT